MGQWSYPISPEPTARTNILLKTMKPGMDKSKNWAAVVLLLLGLSLLSCRALTPALQPLVDPRMHAGCYVENTAGAVVANLSEEDAEGQPLGLFHLDGSDTLLPLQSYSDSLQVFGNDRYRIEIRTTFVAHEPNTCLDYYRFTVRIQQAGRRVRQDTFPGFCGC
jgi:hypothetical protein